ncbi:MAG: hypothetical protein ACP5HG_14830 [Anaerolineae bacterium]
MTRPQLTFFCELDALSLQELFSRTGVIDALVDLSASVSLGLLDLSAERAAIVRRLNEAGVPVVAWLLLPKEEGYWFNADNGPQAVRRYAAFRAWTAEHGLRWAGIGIDIEPDIGEAQSLVEGRVGAVLPNLMRRLVDGARVWRARAIYTTLVTQMALDGYRTESYQIPFIVDERRAGSTLLQRLFGLVDIATRREVLMLYTSFLRPAGPGLLWSYGRDAEGIGIGVTGGGVEIGSTEMPAPLSWPEFARDLRLARRLSRHLYIFSLEGCVRRGYLERLAGFDWSSPVEAPTRQARRVDLARRVGWGLLWAAAHPGVTLGGLLALTALWRLMRRRRRS